MSTIPVIVKHAGKKYNIDLDPTTTGETFKYQLYSLTNVEPERQKIIVKGGQLKDDQDLSKLGFKPNQNLMMMGTPSGGVAIAAPQQPTKFFEDMTAAEAAQTEGATPAGLVNLGNTCYLNSTLQALRAIPELQTELQGYASSESSNGGPSSASEAIRLLGLGGGNRDLTGSLRDLYKDMSSTQDGFSPAMFLSTFRQLYPQFAEQSRDGRGYAQQDAEEAWSQIITQLRNNLKAQDKDQTTIPGGASSDARGFVDEFMGGKFERIEQCNDAAAKEAGEGEPKTLGEEVFFKLNCHVASQDVKHLSEGVGAGLTDTYSKTSPTLNREAEYTTTSRISRLPKYLPVHFVRFFWKRDVQKKAKILRRVTFPHELDVTDYCTPALKAQLVPVRDKIRDLRKEEVDVERARKRQKRMQKADDDATAQAKAQGPAAEASLAASKKPAKKPDGGAAGASTDVEMKDEVYKTDAQLEEERAAQILAAKKALLASVDPALLADRGSSQTGLYELRGVVTHQGASADSGHYTAYVKKEGRRNAQTGKREEEDGKWWWFNDDRVSEVEAEKIETLAGGGESHSALILLYKAVELPVLTDEEKEIKES